MSKYHIVENHMHLLIYIACNSSVSYCYNSNVMGSFTDGVRKNSRSSREEKSKENTDVSIRVKDFQDYS